MGKKKGFETADAVSDRIIGWGSMIAAGIEVVSPSLLAIDLATAGGLATFGFLLATGRGKSIIQALRRAMIND